MIRDITPEDKPGVLRLAKMFYEERLERTGIHYDAQHASAHFDIFIKTPGVLALCAEEDGQVVGMIAGAASAIIFAKELAMQEMVWYVEPEKRNCGLRLLREFEKRSAEKGLGWITMVGMTGDSSVGFYPRLGYYETQRTFMKRLENSG